MIVVFLLFFTMFTCCRSNNVIYFLWDPGVLHYFLAIGMNKSKKLYESTFTSITLTIFSNFHYSKLNEIFSTNYQLTQLAHLFYVLGSSSIWTCRILIICFDFFHSNKYRKVASSNASRFVTRLVYMHTKNNNFLIRSPSQI